MELMPDGVTRKPETNTISKPIEDILNLIDTTIVPSLKHIEKIYHLVISSHPLLSRYPACPGLAGRG